jgi:hypothetical protein
MKPSSPRASKLVGSASLALLCASCVLGPNPKFARRVADGTYCAAKEALDLPRSRGVAEEAGAPARAAEALGYTPRSLDIARAIGALSQVERLAEAVSRNAPDGELADLRGQVNDTISLASLDLASTVAHLACEEGRADQIASDLRDAEQTQIRRLTAYSLVLGAAASVAGGVLAIADKDPVPGGIVGIGGGAVGGAFGLGTMAVHRTTTFRHARNILGELWRGSAHTSFPQIVWAYLTRPQFSRTGDRTLRDYLVEAWSESGRLGGNPQHPSEERIALYFGEGGTYDASGLDDRANMLSDVREIVSLMEHGLQHLAAEVARH